MGNCWQNGALTFVPLTGTSDGAYAIRPYPFGRKKGTRTFSVLPIRPKNRDCVGMMVDGLSLSDEGGAKNKPRAYLDRRGRSRGD